VRMPEIPGLGESPLSLFLCLQELSGSKPLPVNSP
jgi:hypothetical protein